MANNINMSLNLRAAGFNSGITKAQRSLTLLERTAQTVGRTLQYALGGALIAVAADASKAAIDFELAQRKLAALSKGESDDAIQQLSDTARELGENSVYTAAEVANLQVELKKLGLSAVDVNELSEGMVKFATAMDTDAADASKTLIQTINQFKKTLDPTLTLQEKAVLISNQFANAAVSTALSFETLQASMRYVGPVAGSLGLTFSETAAILGELANAGFEGSKAGTVLRRILVNLTKESGDVSKLGEDFYDLIDGTASFSEILDIVGVRAVAGTLALDGLGGSVKELKNKIEDGTNIEDLFEARNGSIDGRLRNLRSAIQEIGIAILDTFGNDIRDAINSIIEWIKSIDEGDIKFAAFMAKLAIYGSTIGALVTKFGELTLALKTLGSTGLLAIGAAGWITLTILAVKSLQGAWETVNDELAKYDKRNTTVESLLAEGFEPGQYTTDLDRVNKKADKVRSVLDQAFDQKKLGLYFNAIREGTETVDSIIEKNEEYIKRQSQWGDINGRSFREVFTSQVQLVGQYVDIINNLDKLNALANQPGNDLVTSIINKDEAKDAGDAVAYAGSQIGTFLQQLGTVKIPTTVAQLFNFLERGTKPQEIKLNSKGFDKDGVRVENLLSYLNQFPDTSLRVVKALDFMKENWASFEAVIADVGATFANALLDPTVKLGDALRDVFKNFIRLAAQWLIQVGLLTGAIALGNLLTGGGLSAFLNTQSNLSGSTNLANNLAQGGGGGRSFSDGSFRSSIAGSDLVIASQRGININSRVYG